MEENRNETVAEKTTEEPKVDNTVEKIKVKKPTVKKFQQTPEVVKVDLKELAKKAEEVTKVDESVPAEEIKVPEKPIEEVKKEEEKEKVKEGEVKVEETPLLEEITNEEEKEPVKTIEEPKQPKIELPENIQKVVEFMKDTGGDLNDYVQLNRDYNNYDNDTLLREYYRTTKPHLQDDEINFLMEDQFSYDEEADSEKDIKRKKLALKEQVADAKTQLEELKSKYYEDIKMGSKLTSEQQDAVEFFNRYNKESKETQKTQKETQDHFLNKTNEVFNDDFKGFEYKVGDKRYRFNVKDPVKTKNTQSDINNFVKKFLNKDYKMEDAKGYHKSLFTAMNSDAIANHFYEQGKADALKDSIAKSKNIDMAPRQSHGGEVEAGGMKFKVLGDNSDDFKFKIKKRK